MEKGKTNNPNGRPKGTPNKITTTVRHWIIDILNDNREQFIKDLNTLEPANRVEVILKLLPYILPKVVNADEVEGAAYTKDDIKTVNKLDFDLNKKEVTRWYDK